MQETEGDEPRNIVAATDYYKYLFVSFCFDWFYVSSSPFLESFDSPKIVHVPNHPRGSGKC